MVGFDAIAVAAVVDAAHIDDVDARPRLLDTGLKQFVSAVAPLVAAIDVAAVL